MDSVKFLEETDHEIAELFMDIANKRYDKFNIKTIIETDNGIIMIPYKILGRNDLCWCNSGKKFKKCCGRE